MPTEEITAGAVPVNGTRLRYERGGHGPAVLLIHGGAENVMLWRAQAAALAQACTVVTYDRRGTGQSGSDDWPGGGAAQHADDAAGLVEALGLGPVVCFGSSSGGVIGIELALRHPAAVRTAFVYEPALVRMTPGGAAAHRAMIEVTQHHLRRHPHDFVGAYAAFVEAVGGAGSWRKRDLERRRREAANARTFVLDDLPHLSGRVYDDDQLRAVQAPVRLAVGSVGAPLLRAASERIAALLHVDVEIFEGWQHTPHLSCPDAVARLIASALS